MGKEVLATVIKQIGNQLFKKNNNKINLEVLFHEISLRKYKNKSCDNQFLPS